MEPAPVSLAVPGVPSARPRPDRAGGRGRDMSIGLVQLVAIGMVSAQEAAELHALETATVGAP
jgi:hypothetical protein